MPNPSWFYAAVFKHEYIQKNMKHISPLCLKYLLRITQAIPQFNRVIFGPKTGKTLKGKQVSRERFLLLSRKLLQHLMTVSIVDLSPSIHAQNFLEIC